MYKVKLMIRWFVAKGMSCASEKTTCYTSGDQIGMKVFLMISYLEVVDNTFSVKVVVGNGKEIPVEGLAPGILLPG